MERECTKCKELKGIENYYWENTRQRYQNICKSCIKIKSEIRYIEKKDIISIKNKEWINNNKEKFKALIKKNRGNYKEYDKEYARSHWKSKKNNPEYQLKHREYQKEYKRLKRLDPIFRLKENLRTYFYRTITLKSKSVFKYLGCTLNEFKTHIEVKFNHKMNWGNYGDYWEVDHIRPIESFNFKDENEIIECWNYKNLQPLTKNKNRIKSNKYERTSGHQPLD
jgi:hypothetical protein